MSFTGKAAGWLAGRLKGEKARKKTMNWMKKTGVGQLLGAAGDAALIGGAGVGAAKGLGALKGLFTAGSAAAAGGTPAPTPTPGGTPAQVPLYKNPQVIAGALGGVSDYLGQRGQQDVEEQRLAQQAEQFQKGFDVSEEERKRQQAQANRLASFFMPTTR